jgi:2,5-diketo-D-gluconate reductase B
MITDNGLRMPKLGLGTWRLKGAECSEAVLGALARGYRHIDTAWMYDNEAAVGEAIEMTSVPREEIHLTTKVWWDQLSPDAMQASIERSLNALKTEYVDLLLIHWPSAEMDLAATLEKLTSIREQGLARHIGVCNFPLGLMRRAIEEIQAPIAVHQFEYHVLIDQSKLVGYCRSKGIAVTAYCPLAQGRLADHPALAEIGAKHNATAAQIGLNWLLEQDGVAAIPKAGRAESQFANLAAQKIHLDDADRAAIAALPKDQRFVNPAFAIGWDS